MQLRCYKNLSYMEDDVCLIVALYCKLRERILSGYSSCK